MPHQFQALYNEWLKDGDDDKSDDFPRDGNFVKVGKYKVPTFKIQFA